MLLYGNKEIIVPGVLEIILCRKNATSQYKSMVCCDFKNFFQKTLQFVFIFQDINKLGQQLQYCYSSNRRAKEPLQVIYLLTSELF